MVATDDALDLAGKWEIENLLRRKQPRLTGYVLRTSSVRKPTYLFLVELAQRPEEPTQSRIGDIRSSFMQLYTNILNTSHRTC